MAGLSFRAPLAWLTGLLLWELALCGSLFALLPAVLLLLVPLAAARHAFEQWASFWKVSWLGAAVGILRVGLGTQVLLHYPGGAAGLRALGDGGQEILVISNHRTTLSWAWLWGAAAALGRLRGWKIVLMHSLKHVPGFGWAMQCFGFAFVRRNSKEGSSGAGSEITTMTRTVEAHGGAAPLTLLLFPEGRDLTDRSTLASNNWADAQTPKLPHLKHVIHPKTAGFVATWQALESRGTPTWREHNPPVLLDSTESYIDYVPGEVPTPVSMFVLGRCPKAVHLHLELVTSPMPDPQNSEQACRRLFAAKEEKLGIFYASPDYTEGKVNAAGAPGAAWTVMGTSLGGLAAFTLLEVVAAGLWWLVGALPGFLVLVALALVFVAISCAGGVDGLLLWHSRRWPGKVVAREPPLLAATPS